MTSPIITGLPKTLYLATTNAYKLAEMQAWAETNQLPFIVQALPQLVDVEETGTTFLANAQLKAQGQVSAHPLPADAWVLAEDSGLSIPVLTGQYGLNPFPGVQSNRWLTPERWQALCPDSPAPEKLTDTHHCEALLALIAKHPHLPRPLTAAYHAALVVVNTHGQEVFATEQTLALTLRTTATGDGGFGYDPIIQITGHTAPSVACMSPAEKNTISHRGKALSTFAQFLRHSMS